MESDNGPNDAMIIFSSSFFFKLMYFSFLIYCLDFQSTAYKSIDASSQVGTYTFKGFDFLADDHWSSWNKTYVS